MENENNLFALINRYLKIYLPIQRQCSTHTVISYTTSLNFFIEFIARKEGIESDEVTLESFTKENVEDFLIYLNTERASNPATMNARVAAIRSFLHYAANYVPEIYRNVIAVSNIRKIPEEPKTTIDYLSEDAIKAIINSPDTSTSVGRRDQMFFVLLYDTGARIQEIMNLKLYDVCLSDFPTVKLFGKGRKTRVVPIMKSTVELLNKYIQEFHPDENLQSSAPLFYAMSYGKKVHMSTKVMRERLKKYRDIARKKCNDIPDNLHPHIFRHSRAMHLYQHGMDLTMISQWLGHSDMKVTLVYAYADTEAKRKAIQNAMGMDVNLVEDNTQA